jgi:Rps23 Pro-64 3,4-dihydroxylase Tpa1-like proline 4-hydroxylase
MQTTPSVEAFAHKIATRLSEASLEDQWIDRRPDTPTKYAVIDDLLAPEDARSIYEAFDPAQFDRRDSFRERKSTSSRFDEVPSILRDITFAFQQPEVVNLIGDAIVKGGVSADPTLYAGGLSMMERGDFLNPHIDNSHNGGRTHYRRLNLLYYVTPDWRVEDGGNLELWDVQVRRPVTIFSKFNRLVLMETNRWSWHSVSPVVVDRRRCCVSNYYFSQRSHSYEHYYHVTSFTGRPGQPIRRALGVLDNAARNLARQLGAKRASDAGYTGAK